MGFTVMFAGFSFVIPLDVSVADLWMVAEGDGHHISSDDSSFHLDQGSCIGYMQWKYSERREGGSGPWD